MQAQQEAAAAAASGAMEGRVMTRSMRAAERLKKVGGVGRQGGVVGRLQSQPVRRAGQEIRATACKIRRFSSAQPTCHVGVVS